MLWAGFGYLSGLQVKGYKACPTCGPGLDDVAVNSVADHKIVYLHHTKYLPDDHPYRRDINYYVDPLLGQHDVRPRPDAKDLAYYHTVWKNAGDPTHAQTYFRCGIVFMSSLNNLEYWPHLLLPHLLDPMHIEGNVGKSLIGHIFGERGPHWRAACLEHNMHHALWTHTVEGTETVVYPDADWILSREEKEELIHRLSSYRMPTGYGANLRRAFGQERQEKWPAYLKTHDYHRLLQHILPVAIIGLGSPELQKAIWSLGKLMRWVCGKTINPDEIGEMDVFSVEVVCELQRALPPSFFDGQIHMLIHLVREVSLAGPVHCRWMYWVERCMGQLKRFMRNTRWVEGSISEGYLAAESMFYCSNIIATIDPHAPRSWKENDDTPDEHLTGARKKRQLTTLELGQINVMMLSNSDATEDWRMYYEEEKTSSHTSSTFPRFEEYLRRKVDEVDGMVARGEQVVEAYPEVTNELRTLVAGPLYTVETRTAMWVQGRHFRIARLDDKKEVTMDCGVLVHFTMDFRSSRHDQNLVTAMVPYYGKVEEIVILTYKSWTEMEVVLFKCKWYKSNLRGVNATVVEDDCGFTRLKTSASSTLRQDWSTSDPFAFPHQVEQCFYLPYPPDPEDWSIVIPYTPRSRAVVQEKSEVMIVDDIHE